LVLLRAPKNAAEGVTRPLWRATPPQIPRARHPRRSLDLTLARRDTGLCVAHQTCVAEVPANRPRSGCATENDATSHKEVAAGSRDGGAGPVDFEEWLLRLRFFHWFFVKRTSDNKTSDTIWRDAIYVRITQNPVMTCKRLCHHSKLVCDIHPGKLASERMA
jgi:hypothetical protein